MSAALRSGAWCAPAWFASALDGSALLIQHPRPFGAALRMAAAAIAGGPARSMRLPVAQGDAEAAINDALAGLDAPQQAAAVLAGDIRWILDGALQATGGRSVTLRLERLDHTACPRFHVDRLRMRLCCTYTGPGTQWLPEHAVNRAGLGVGNATIVRDPGAIEQLPTGVVAAMGGALSGPGLVHRSPPASNDVPRLFLSIDM